MSQKQVFKFRLYVAGDTLNSGQAVANLNSFCQIHLAQRYEIEVIDVFKEPIQTLQDSIFMTPSLIKLSPLPVTRIIGVLSQTEVLVQALGLDTVFYE